MGRREGFLEWRDYSIGQAAGTLWCVLPFGAFFLFVAEIKTTRSVTRPGSYIVARRISSEGSPNCRLSKKEVTVTVLAFLYTYLPGYTIYRDMQSLKSDRSGGEVPLMPRPNYET